MKLYTLYDTPPFNLLRHKFVQLILPTEVVLRSMDQQIPSFARGYETNYNAVREGESLELITNEEIRQTAQREDKLYHEISSLYRSARLLEFFENEGDDGHIEYTLRGWMFVRADELKPDCYLRWDDPLFRKIQDELYKQHFPHTRK